MKNPSQKTTRNSSIELLRILAMFFIVLSHTSVHGGFPSERSEFFLNNLFLDWTFLGNLGVDIFVIISGYFLSQKELKPQSVIKLLSQVWFFSILCFAVCYIAGYQFSMGDLITVILPTLRIEYWFFTVYIILLLLTPYINTFVANASRKVFLQCLITMFILWSVIPLLTKSFMYANELLQFVMLYLVGAYLRKHPDNLLEKRNLRVSVTIISSVLMFASSAIIRIAAQYIPALSVFVRHFYSRNSFLTISFAVGLFAIAIYAKPFSNRIVNTISSCCFGIYLLHDNPFIRKLLWSKWMNNAPFYHEAALMFRLIFSAIVVFAVGFIIEFIRQYLVEKPVTHVLNVIYNKINNKLHAVISSIKSR